MSEVTALAEQGISEVSEVTALAKQVIKVIKVTALVEQGILEVCWRLGNHCYKVGNF